MTVIATAGHVDHGKSTFVNFLTQQETDRLPEEKKRGLTINLGYTYFTIEDKTYSIVDVPGHKDFYKNTISGFANADVILFIIDSIQNWSEQSEQHFQSLTSLNKKNFIFVFTKIDLLEGEVKKEFLNEKLNNNQDINYIILEFNKKTSKRKVFCASIHDFIKTCKFEEKTPRLWIDRSFTIDGTGKVITGTATKGLDYENIIYNLHNEKLQIKEVQSKNQKNDKNDLTKRVALSLKKTNKNFPSRGDLLSNEEISFSSNLFIKLNNKDVDRSILKGTLRVFFGTNNAHISKIKFINSEKETFAILSLTKAVPIPIFENLLIENVDRNKYIGGQFLLFPDKNQFLKLNNKIKNKVKINNLLDIFDFLDIKFFENNKEFKQIENLFVNESVLEKIFEDLQNNIDSINKTGVKDFFQDNYQISPDILEQLIKGKENITISNNQIIKKIDNSEALENQYIKIKELLGKALDVNIINTKEFDRNNLRDLFLSEKIYRVDSKIIISDVHLKQLVKIIELMPDEFSVKEFKDKTSLSRKYAIPYLELLDKIGVTQKIDKVGSRKKL
ncbi:SelB C-terminal domain-containing protein [Acidimicrobiaceae bacterium]|nr:SelB C-terminal domain-containing protein [Acidimicrobiaceae bacterium]